MEEYEYEEERVLERAWAGRGRGGRVLALLERREGSLGIGIACARVSQCVRAQGREQRLRIEVQGVKCERVVVVGTREHAREAYNQPRKGKFTPRELEREDARPVAVHSGVGATPAPCVHGRNAARPSEGWKLERGVRRVPSHQIHG